MRRRYVVLIDLTSLQVWPASTVQRKIRRRQRAITATTDPLLIFPPLPLLTL